MGLEAGTIALIGTALSAAGAGTAAYNQYRTAQRQEDQALKGMAAQRTKQREIDERLNAEITNLEGSSPEDERAASLDAYLSQLRANRGSAEGVSTPGVSRYGADTEASQASVRNYGQRAANVLSRLDATRDQRINESRGFGRAASDVAGVARAASGEDFINRLRMAQIQPNVWIDAASGIARGAGAGMVDYAGRMDPMKGLEEIDITAQRIPTGSSAWAGRVPNPSSRFG